MAIDDSVLADEIIRRLNDLIKDQTVRSNLTQLMEERVTCSGELADHPTVQTHKENGSYEVGFLGMLNGIIGAIPSGPKKSWGYVAAVLDDKGWLLRFQRTEVASSDP